MDALGIMSNSLSPFGEKPSMILSGQMAKDQSVTFQAARYMVFHVFGASYSWYNARDDYGESHFLFSPILLTTSSMSGFRISGFQTAINLGTRSPISAISLYFVCTATSITNNSNYDLSYTLLLYT